MLLELLLPLVAGSLLGLALAFLLQRAAVSTFDSEAGLGLVVATWGALLATAMIAVFLPLRRAAGLDPMKTLGSD